MDQISNESKLILKNDKDVIINKKDSQIIVLVSLIIASLYNFLFVGKGDGIQSSFAIFSLLCLIIITITLEVLKYFKNIRAYLWVIPITLISFFNAKLNISLFSYFNVIVMFILFATYVICAINKDSTDIFNTTMAFVIIKTAIGNIFIFTKIIQKAVAKSVNSQKKNILIRVLFGVLLSIPILFIIMILLASADAVFNRFATDFFDYFSNIRNINSSHLISFVVVFIYTIGYISQSRIDCIEGYNQIECNHKRVDTIVGSTFLILINVLFLLFSVIQIAFLFTGGFMELPQGMVYSEYAREGFFQLLLVTVINFCVIIVFLTTFDGATESKILKILLLSLCLFTCVLIASSFYRMYMYISAYGYTTLRLCVITFLSMEIFLILVTVLRLFKERFLFGKWFIITCFVFYLIVNVTGSEYFSNILNNKFHYNVGIILE